MSGNHRQYACFFVLFFMLCVNPELKAQTHTEKLKIKFVFDGDGLDASHIPLFNADFEPVFVTDSTGIAEFTVGDTVYVRSLFYADTMFVVQSNMQPVISLNVSPLTLAEVIIAFKPVDKQMDLTMRLFEKHYVKSPFIAHSNAYYYFRGQGQFLEFNEMAGLTLFSGYKKWKPWSFAPDGEPHAYIQTVPIENRRSLHWDYKGDTIPSIDREKMYDRNGPRWNVRPYMYRPLYRALEESGPMWKKNKKFYDFEYNYDEETEQFLVVNFRTKNRYREKETGKLFLIGEGKLYISKDSDHIEKIEYDYSKYMDINFEQNRQGRKKDIAGTIAVTYVNGQIIFPESIEFSCYYLGRNWYPPRPDPVDQNLNSYEKILFSNHTQDLIDSNENDTYKTFSFIDTESYAEYDPTFWKQDNFVEKPLYDKIHRDLSFKIDLTEQYEMNAGNRFAKWNNDNDYLLSLFPKAKNPAEAKQMHKELVQSVKEEKLEVIYRRLK